MTAVSDDSPGIPRNERRSNFRQKALLRGLIDAIILTPSDRELRIELKGNLAAMLSAATNAKRSSETGDLELQMAMVAGTRSRLKWSLPGRRPESDAFPACSFIRLRSRLSSARATARCRAESRVDSAVCGQANDLRGGKLCQTPESVRDRARVEGYARGDNPRGWVAVHAFPPAVIHWAEELMRTMESGGR